MAIIDLYDRFAVHWQLFNSMHVPYSGGLEAEALGHSSGDGGNFPHRPGGAVQFLGAHRVHPEQANEVKHGWQVLSQG